MLKTELDYQVGKAIEYIDKGGDFKKWMESKEFTWEEQNYIKNHQKIIEKQTRK